MAEGAAEAVPGEARDEITALRAAAARLDDLLRVGWKAADEMELGRATGAVVEALRALQTAVERERGAAAEAAAGLGREEEETRELEQGATTLARQLTDAEAELKSLEADAEDVRNGSLATTKRTAGDLEAQVTPLRLKLGQWRVQLAPLEQEAREVEGARAAKDSLLDRIAEAKAAVSAAEQELDTLLGRLQPIQGIRESNERQRDHELANCLEMALRLKLKHGEPPEWADLLDMVGAGNPGEQTPNA